MHKIKALEYAQDMQNYNQEAECLVVRIKGYYSEIQRKPIIKVCQLTLGHHRV